MIRRRLSALLLLPWLAACSRPGPGDHRFDLATGDVWIRDVTMISPERPAPLPHAHVVVRAGHVVLADVQPPRERASTNVTVLEGAGKFLVPGLIDGHVHLAGVPGMSEEQEAALPNIAAAYDRQMPRSYLYFGFTAVVDLNVVDRNRTERLRHAAVGPAVFDCGNGLSLANGYPMAYLPPAARFERFPNFLYDSRQAAAIPTKYSPDEHSADAAVARVSAGGGKCVKSYYERGFAELAGKLPTPTVDLMRRVRDASHRHGLPLLLHANTLEAHRFAVDAGVDVVAHGLWNWGAGDNSPEPTSAVRDVLDAERKAGMGMMPTSRVIGGLADVLSPAFLADPHVPRVLPAALLAWYRSQDGQWFAREVSQSMPPNGRDILIRIQKHGQQAAVYFASQGGRIVFGSDTPSAPTYANPPGYNGYLELRELEEAGVPPRQLLAAATIENARLFGLADYGTIAPGKIASLLLLRGNPLDSTAAFDAIDTVMVAGRVMSRASLLPEE